MPHIEICGVKGPRNTARPWTACRFSVPRCHVGNSSGYSGEGHALWMQGGGAVQTLNLCSQPKLRSDGSFGAWQAFSLCLSSLANTLDS